MQAVKEGNIITITLSDEESSAVDYFIHKRGANILDEYFGFFFQSRVNAKIIEERDELYRVMTEEERKKFLERQL